MVDVNVDLTEILQKFPPMVVHGENTDDKNIRGDAQGAEFNKPLVSPLQEIGPSVLKFDSSLYKILLVVKNLLFDFLDHDGSIFMFGALYNCL